MQTSVTKIELKLTDSFEVAFPDKLIPSNSYLDKSKTGLGMTYSEFHAERHSIIVIPYTSIIDLKAKEYKYKQPLKIVDEVKAKAIEEYLTSDVKYKKLITTPEGFKKIIDAAIALDKLDWLYEHFFCLLDEAHCYAVEAFRKFILTPFNYFWKFVNKALGTATYFPYSDSRFNKLTHYKITYDKPFGKITIVDHKDPKAVLNHFLTHPEKFPGNVHIFYNSVKEIEKVIRAAGIKDVNVYCRDEERNHKILGDSAIHFKYEPCADDYKKFNFYSARYYDGWDLFDNDKATIILVTDISVKHSLVGIPYNGFQSVGRLRKVSPHKIYHVTNNFGKEDKDVRSFDHISKNWHYQASNHAQYYNDFKFKACGDGMEEKQETWKLAHPFCKFTSVTMEAYVYPMKVDQHICKEYSIEGYSNIGTIERHWQEMNYETELNHQKDLKPLEIKGVPKSTVNRQVIEMIEEYAIHPDKYSYSQADIIIGKLRDQFKDLLMAHNRFGKAELERLGYDDKAIRKALVDHSNANQEHELKTRAKSAFEFNIPYTTDRIAAILQKIYDDLRIKASNGKRKKVKATDLERLNVFLITKTQRKDEAGTINPKTGKIKRVPVWILDKLPDAN
ncbi:hypothetical protein CPT03_19035 [Pedobacter ginsengisoli]|uniref:Uncharacterized protein n=1 Tax=Pedobacter ginsengisoli TaxID=363852 RepID=A0A2D1U9Z0_9SPHI|nr:hypothetical protein [Pedobacter ginsengisoli]ATP58406.1 hypothetical protein CPT03_19035 [Pedobacter ginsengisoli]